MDFVSNLKMYLKQYGKVDYLDEKLKGIFTKIYIRHEITKMFDEDIFPTIIHDLKNLEILGFVPSNKIANDILNIYKLSTKYSDFDYSNEEHKAMIDLGSIQEFTLNFKSYFIDNIIRATNNNYCFDCEDEFLLTKLNYPNLKIVWEEVDEEYDFLNQAIAFFEDGIYFGSINCLENYLVSHPTSLNARIEFCNTLVALGRIDDAFEFLNDFKEFLYSDELIAYYYRSIGRFFNRKNDVLLSCACYKFSLEFDSANNDANKMVSLLQKKGGYLFVDKDIPLLFSKHNIPVLKSRNLNDILANLKNKHVVILPEEANGHVNEVVLKECTIDEERMIISTYNKIAKGIFEILKDDNIYRETIPFLIFVCKLAYNRKGKESSIPFYSVFENLYKDRDFDTFINQRMCFYSDIINTKRFMAYWDFSDEPKEYVNALHSLVMIFGDICWNSECLKDYWNTPFLPRGISQATRFSIFIKDEMSSLVFSLFDYVIQKND